MAIKISGLLTVNLNFIAIFVCMLLSHELFESQGMQTKTVRILAWFYCSRLAKIVRHGLFLANLLSIWYKQTNICSYNNKRRGHEYIFMEEKSGQYKKPQEYELFIGRMWCTYLYSFLILWMLYDKWSEEIIMKKKICVIFHILYSFLFSLLTDNEENRSKHFAHRKFIHPIKILSDSFRKHTWLTYSRTNMHNVLENFKQ